MTYPNGDIYIGDFNGKKRHGMGTFKYKNGDIYNGEFKDGNRHG